MYGDGRLWVVAGYVDGFTSCKKEERLSCALNTKTVMPKFAAMMGAWAGKHWFEHLSSQMLLLCMKACAFRCFYGAFCAQKR